MCSGNWIEFGNLDPISFGYRISYILGYRNLESIKGALYSPPPHKPNLDILAPQLQREQTMHVPPHFPIGVRFRFLPGRFPLVLGHLARLLSVREVIQRQLDAVGVEDGCEDGHDFYLGEAPAETGAGAFAEGDVGAAAGAVE